MVRKAPVGSLLSSMAVFVLCDRKLQRAYYIIYMKSTIYSSEIKSWQINYIIDEDVLMEMSRFSSYVTNRIYDKTLDRDWFSTGLIVT